MELQTEESDYNGIKLAFGPKVLLDPTFGVTLKELKSKLQGSIKVSKDSTLVLVGKNTVLKDVTLDGTLVTKEGDNITGDQTNN